jgi:hypothetical protein
MKEEGGVAIRYRDPSACVEAACETSEGPGQPVGGQYNVGIHKGDVVSARGRDACGPGGPAALVARQRDDPYPQVLSRKAIRDPSRVVGRRIVDHDELELALRVLSRQRPQAGGNIGGLVEGDHDERHAGQVFTCARSTLVRSRPASRRSAIGGWRYRHGASGANRSIAASVACVADDDAGRGRAVKSGPSRRTRRGARSEMVWLLDMVHASVTGAAHARRGLEFLVGLSGLPCLCPEPL